MSDSSLDNSDNLDKENEAIQPIVNRIANSGLVTLNLEDHYPDFELAELDVSRFLFQGLLLKEKEFKKHLAEFNWSKFKDKAVAVHCSTDALIQPWAYMMISKELNLHARMVHYGSKRQMLVEIYRHIICTLDLAEYEDKRVMVRGCSKKDVPIEVYGLVSNRLLPVVKSLLYGEACSNVPIFKKK